MQFAIKTVEQFFDLLHKNTGCNSLHQSFLKETKENYIWGNFMIIVQSERSIAIVRIWLNSYMSPYFLLQNNEGKTMFLTLRNNAV